MRCDAVLLALLGLALPGLRWASGDDQSRPPPRNGSPSFRDDVMPMLDRLGCSAAACQCSPANKTTLRLSMFGASPEEDYAAIVKSAEGKRINRAAPEQSCWS